jgi:hypothetical protein
MPSYPLVINFANYLGFFINFIIANYILLSNLLCSSLGVSIYACRDSGYHLVGYDSDLLIFEAVLIPLCDSPPPPPLPLLEFAPPQIIVVNDGDAHPKCLVKRNSLRKQVVLFGCFHVLSWSNCCIFICLPLLTIASSFVNQLLLWSPFQA